MRNPDQKTEVNVTVGTSWTTLVERQYAGWRSELLLGLKNHGDGGVAFSNLRLQIRAYPGADWQTWREGSEWGTVDEAMPSVGDDDPHTLADGSTTFARLVTGPIHAARVQAKVASGATTADAGLTAGGA
ncbi:MAG: hypothetical protein ACLFV3_09130 [Phycisphaeraceae bacterium]